MNIKLNGEIKTINHSDKELFLEELISQFGFQTQLVVVELNGTIINSKEWITTKINNGDCLEVVTIVGGGSYS
tara:strand:- start:209 stop:427 length:219 start_codon:yes stop_codon:yes gene_type:complete